MLALHFFDRTERRGMKASGYSNIKTNTHLVQRLRANPHIDHTIWPTIRWFALLFNFFLSFCWLAIDCAVLYSLYFSILIAISTHFMRFLTFLPHNNYWRVIDCTKSSRFINIKWDSHRKQPTAANTLQIDYSHYGLHGWKPDTSELCAGIWGWCKCMNFDLY